MLAVNDMFTLSRPYIKSLFWEDVQEYLDKNDIRSSARVRFSGKSGFDQEVDFLIPKSSAKPERMLKVVTSPNRNTITSALFALSDIVKLRKEEIQAFTILNDNHKELSKNYSEAFQQYEITPLLWSDRTSFIQELAA
jgi:regulatory protein YycH of two-component signal transduction system YycFG